MPRAKKPDRTAGTDTGRSSQPDEEFPLLRPATEDEAESAEGQVELTFIAPPDGGEHPRLQPETDEQDTAEELIFIAPPKRDKKRQRPSRDRQRG